MATPRRIADIKPLFTNLAQTSHFEVRFAGLPPDLVSYLNSKGVDYNFIARDAGLLCYSAQLPTTQLATAEINGNFMGIQEKFAHSRIYSPINLEFYVDKDYKVIKFLESWMEFIASGSSNPIGISDEKPATSPNVTNYFVRMQYPTYYKSNATKITKFDRDYFKEIEYNFIGLFPLNMNSIQVSYDSSQILRASASFQYDRYIAGKVSTFSEYLGDNNNKDPSSRSSQNPQLSAEELNTQKQQSQVFTFGVDPSLNSTQSGRDLLSNNKQSAPPLTTSYSQSDWTRKV